mgnify:CR=1 FL=1
MNNLYLQLREQRDRAEKDLKEEKDLHDREITDFKMKIHTLESELEKLQMRLDKKKKKKDKLEVKLEFSQTELGKFLLLFIFIFYNFSDWKLLTKTFYICHHSLVSNFSYYFFYVLEHVVSFRLCQKNPSKFDISFLWVLN